MAEPDTSPPGVAPIERLLVYAAFSALALFVVYDTMIDLRPGVARSEHFAALIALLTLIGLTAWQWPQLRPEQRALILVTFGIVSLAGSFAVRGDRTGGGTDWSWLLLLVPGAGMLIGGIVLAFSGRRREGRVVRRRIAIAFGLLFYAWWVVLPLTMAVLATHRPVDEPANYEIGPGQREVRIETGDGVELTATYVPSRNGAVVITYPTKEWTASESRMLAQAGYGVLALEMRGYGESGGDVNRYGWDAAADVDAAVAFLAGEEGVDRIGGFGSSVGGEAMIDAAADNEELTAIVSEGAGERSIRETLIRGPAAVLALPQAAVLTVATAVLSGDSPPPSLEDEVARISPRAVFLINAENGSGGEELNADYARAAGEPKALWTVPGAEHTGGMAARPAEYASRVIDFFDRHLKPAGGEAATTDDE